MRDDALETRRRRTPLDAFHPHLKGSRLLVLCTTGVGVVGTVAGVSGRDLTLEAGEDQHEVIAPDDVRRLWILRPSAELLALAAVGKWVRVLRADGSRVMGRVLEELAFGGFLVLSCAGLVEVSWLDVQELEPVAT